MSTLQRLFILPWELTLGPLQIRHRPLVQVALSWVIGTVASTGILIELRATKGVWLGAGAVFGLVSFIGFWRRGIIPRLAWHTRKFSRLEGTEAVLYHSATFREKARLPKVLFEIELELRELRHRFGKGPIRVDAYLCGDASEASTIYGWPVGGFALSPATIVLADGPCLSETIRHELAHLFLPLWGPCVERLLIEGFAVWWQQTKEGLPIDTHALEAARDRKFSLADLKGRGFLRQSDIRRCYMIAGSFTGYLIRRLGWSGYRWFYQAAACQALEKALREVGMSLEKAEARWRAHISLAQLLRKRAANGGMALR